MNRPPTLLQRLIAGLAKVLNLVLGVACALGCGWAAHLYWVRRALPYSAAGTYLNPRTGITYSQSIVPVALGLAVLFGLLTVLLLYSAYRLYGRGPRRKFR